jgi:hypothetical protein
MKNNEAAPDMNCKKTVPHYHLRFQIIPGANVKRDANTLAALCVKHKIEEVVLFFAAEEWNNGLLSKTEEDAWFKTVKDAKEILENSGIEVSLNPWMTSLHCDRGRKFPEGRKFQPMVSPSGKVSRACASFADPEWRKYLYGLYGRFASLGFRVLWVEDDFRYHNHAPLDWGGGFEPSILKRFSRKIGRTVSRKELTGAILKPGRPHPWRSLWMETWREIKLEVAKGLAEAVSSNAPESSKIGIMSSGPAVHSAEGRDWGKLFGAFMIDGKVAHRPHFQWYSDTRGPDIVYSFCMLDIQKDLRPDNCEVAPEIENSPFTSWNKSDSLSWAHMSVAQFFGSDALLLDVFPFSGNPADSEPEIWNMLDRSQPALKWIGKRFTKDLRTQGVGIPWRQNAQELIRTEKGKSLNELHEPDCTAHSSADFLMRYGIAVSLRRQESNAVFGRLAWIFSDDELRELLSGGLLLDAASAEILCQRGFGKDIGVDFLGMADREDDSFSLEKVACNECGVEKGLYFNFNKLLKAGRLRPLRGAREWTEILRPDRSKFGSGIVTFENKLGGRIATLASSDPGSVPKCGQRQLMIQSAVRFCAGGYKIATVNGGPYLIMEEFAGAGRRLFTIFNASPDSARPVIKIGGVLGKIRATILKPLEQPVPAAIEVKKNKDCSTVIPDSAIPYLGILVIEIKCA